MSNSPAASQAAADNRQFWSGVAKLPEPAQKSFWDGGTLLSHYIGENPQPRTLTYDFSSPPASMPWYERIFFYIGQSQVNQAVSQMQTGQAMVDGAVWLAGALQGDFNKSPTTGQMITGGIISMIPVVDQVCDVRDIVANCLNLSDPKAREDTENWVALGLTCIGFVPLAGSAVKTVGKVAMHRAGKLIDLLKQMEWLEKHRGSLKIMIPWGHAPIDWLRKFDWQAACKQAADKARAAFLSAKGKAEAAAKYAFGFVQAKLKQLIELFDAIAKRIGQVMQDVAKSIREKVNKLLARADKEAGNYDATPGGPNRHVQKDRVPTEAARARKRSAAEFYRRFGLDEDQARAHMRGIDFDKPVDTVILKKGTVVEQWQVPGGSQGSYYAPTGTPPGQLGISSRAVQRRTGELVERVPTRYVLSQDVEVLRSTAARVTDTWSIPGSSVEAAGGGTQYFSNAVSAFIRGGK
jgi:ElaB/YqjD/DUF883 family membrane-anchored ribosome-binding protein